MKLMISGSMTFAHDILALQKKLEKLGHTVALPLGMEPHLTDTAFTDNLEEDVEYCIKNDVIRRNFEQIKNQDAMLVFNKKKNDTQGYMGVSMLMELAIAYFLKKKIFILYDIPHFRQHRWAHEVTIMQPTFLHENLENIK